MKKTMMFLTAALSAMALALLTAGPAAALPTPWGGPKPYNYSLFKHASGGLGGSIGYIDGNGYYKTISTSDPRIEVPETSGNRIVNIYAGSGYCVWEELYTVSKDIDFMQKVEERTYGKDTARRLHTLRIESTRGLTQNAQYATLKVYAC